MKEYLKKDKILVFDGAMGSQIIKAGVKDNDCTEYLNISQPEIISNIHKDYLQAGAQVIETNTFGGAEHILAEHKLNDKTKQINKAAAALAKKAVKKYSNCFVAGSIGPGSKLPSLRQISFDELKKSYAIQVQGLLAGGIDAFIIETSQDLLQLKAALAAIIECNSDLPIIAQVTINETGSTLTGSDITAVLATLEPWPITAIGLNCGLGPSGMFETIKYLSEHSSKLISVMPNAGLPELEDGQTVYKLAPLDFAKQMEKIARDFGVNIVGGCCGTTPEHIKELVKAVENVPSREPKKAQEPKLSSLFQAQNINVEPKPLIIGERANANGSKKFRKILSEDNYQAAAELAIAQEKEGAHLLDLAVACVGRDEVEDIKEMVSILNSQTQLPLMIDSTDPEVIEAALKCISGRAVINSINLEDGGIKAKKIIKLCNKYKAAVVALAIDEEGMAMTKAQKISVIKRLIALIKKGGLEEKDIFIDALTFTLGSGEEKTKNAGKETLAAIKEVKKLWPTVNTMLGVSNISYGLSGSSRKFLNSCFLHHAIEHGLDAAIMHSGKITSLHSIPKQVLKLCDDLIFNRDKNSAEQFINYFSNYSAKNDVKVDKHLSPEEQLKQNVIDGVSEGVDKTLDDVLAKNEPMKVINNMLLPAMNEVGDLFREGQKQLPFVLRSAEVMRSAMSYLQPLLGKQAENKGTLVLATVRGDIHDIGKNLVDIIFSANGYKVVNLGVKQSAENIATAVKEHKADVVGLSGLLVESVKAMKEYLEHFNSIGVDVPVICGGAALRRDYLEEEMRTVYKGEVYYAKDALDGLKIMNKIMS